MASFSSSLKLPSLFIIMCLGYYSKFLTRLRMKNLTSEKDYLIQHLHFANINERDLTREMSFLFHRVTQGGFQQVGVLNHITGEPPDALNL